MGPSVRRDFGPKWALAVIVTIELLSPATGTENPPALHGGVSDRSTGAPLAGVTVTTDANGGTQVVTPAGAGIVPTYTVAPTTVALSSVTNVASAPQLVTLTNTGTVALPIKSITLSGTNHVQFSETNTCGTSVAVGATCTISVVFKPTSIGSKTATLHVNAGSGAGAQTVVLSGTGVAPHFTVSPTVLAFGSETTNVASAAQSVTVTNIGSTSLSVTSIAIAGANALQFSQINTCGTSVGVGAACTISVVFKPTSTGSKTATLHVNAGSGAGTQTVVLSGTGVAPPFTVSPTVLAFGSETTNVASAAQSVTVTNTDTVALPIASITISGPNSLQFSQINNCGTSVEVGATCTINVVFKPTSIGSRTATLNVNAGGGAGTQKVALSGTGIVLTYTISPTSVAFGSVQTGVASPPQVLTLTNTGTLTLPIANILFSGANANAFSETDNCTPSVAAGAVCTVNVVFTPISVGTNTATLNVSSGGADGTASVPLSGIGAIPVVGQPLPVISVGLPIYASSAQYPVANANGGNYNQQWRSIGVPVTLALDLSTVPAAQRQSIWLVWYNDATYSYDHPLIGEVGYNNPGAYTLAANAAPGGTAPPTAGWVQLASISGNTLHSYSQNVIFAGYNWIQYTFTASDGSPENTDIALNLDVYDSSNGVSDGWFFNGDSITANCMAHDNIDAQDEYNPSGSIVITAPSFGQQVNAIVGNNTPEQENAGLPGFTSGDMIPNLANWLANIPSKYVTINLGTNDAAGSVPPTTYYANMATLVQVVIAAGKVPVIPTIPYSLDPTHLANTPALNEQIQTLYQAYPAIVPGPDLWTYFMNNPQYISTDNVHPNAQGCAAYRTLWAQFAASAMYGM
jgi:lysophospholipase L1-like esterase